MKRTIITTSPTFGKVGRLPQFMADRDWELIRCSDTAIPDGGLGQHIDKMEYLVVGLLPATAEVMDKAPKLKAILKHGVGVDNIDIPAATARKLPVLSTPGANANAVVELALAGMLCMARRIPQAYKSMTENVWDRRPGSEIEGKVLGIVGFGNIGKLLARKAVALGMSVIAYDLFPDHEYAKANNVKMAGLDDVLREADYVSLHIFGGKDNTNLINAGKLALMKPTARLLNMARGEVLDLDALNDALNKDALAGAAIDAFVVEPPDFGHPIFRNDKVVFTPHSGGDTAESLERVGLMVLEDIEALEKGERPRRVLNPEVFG